LEARVVTEGHRIRAMHRSQDGTLTEGSDKPFVERAFADEGGLLWLDLHVRSEADGDLLSEVFQFHPLTVEDSVTPRVDPAKIDDYGDYVFIVVQALHPYEPGLELESSEVDFYLGQNYVVSCHLAEIPAIDEFRDRCYRDERLMSRRADWLLHGLLDALVDEYLPIVDAVDDAIDDVEARMMQRPDTHLLREILRVKRTALRLRRATTPQREIMSRLSRGEFSSLISPEAAVYFRDIHDHLVRVDYLVEALRDLGDGALQTYLSVVSNRLNEIMKVLTAAAAIFIPLTLISGIYGMNFEENQFPSFAAPWGFAVVVGAMIAIALGLLLYFRWRKWI
jgi:magnesium transporter